jgi:integron integrase
MTSKSEIVARVRARVRLRHYSLRTEEAYCGWVGRYYEFCLGLLQDLEPERKAEAFLTEMAVGQRMAAQTQNQALAAILFLYREVLGRPLGDVNALRAKRPSRERVSPSRDQVRRLRAAVEDKPNTPARLLVDLLYGCGLRVSEPLELRIMDILWEENQLVVRGAKGGKDRRVPIPWACVGPLRRQIAHARGVWEHDRAKTPEIGVSLPNQLAKKYPQAPFTWQWFWVFPAAGHCADPYSGKMVRYHLLHDSLQRAVHEAAVKAGLEGLVSPHVLRHAYATHSRENIDVLRKLMGHVSIETTAGYRHPGVDTATNPLDDLVI